MQRLEGKTALVTGAARGIGQAIAELFVNEGADVFITDINDNLGKELSQKIGSKAQYLRLNVACEDDWKKVTDNISEKYGCIDIVVNNAGITGFFETEGPHDPENLNLESWHKVHQTNLDGVALGCKYAIKLMKQSKAGSIVNISSRSGLVGIPAATAYA